MLVDTQLKGNVWRSVSLFHGETNVAYPMGVLFF